jgi:hypothetical protein
MVRIALQISGRLRFTPASITSIMASLIETHNPDIFCSFWNTENLSTVDRWTDYIKPKLIEIEYSHDICTHLNLLFPENIHRNMPYMLYKFYRAKCLRETYQRANNITYDYVIQARSDNLFFERLPSIENICKDDTGIWCSNSRQTPEIDSYISPRMVDNFYLGDCKSIDIVSNTLWHLKLQIQQYQTHNQLHHIRIPEIIQSQIWQNMGIKIHSLPGTSPFGNFNYEIDRSETEYR